MPARLLVGVVVVEGCGARWASDSRSWARPRWMRERTVPSLMPRVAATLGIKLGTVRSRIHRGRAQLRESLAHRAPQPSTTTPTKARGRIIRRPAAGTV